MGKSLTQQVGEIKEPLSQLVEQTKILIDSRERLKRLEGGLYKNKMLYYMILGIPILLFWILCIISRWGNNTSDHPENNPDAVFYITASGVIIIISAVVAFVVKMIREVEINNTREKVNNTYTKVKKLTETLKKNNVSIIPPDYRYRAALDFIYKALLNQRAMTMQEAVNLYEADLHQKNMEGLQKHQIELLKQQAEEIKKMRKSTKRIEFYEAWEFIFR